MIGKRPRKPSITPNITATTEEAMTREQKIQYIRRHALDLQELSKAYSEAASVAEALTDLVLNAMLEVALKNNQLHNNIADTLEDA